MSIVRYTNKKTGVVSLYESTSHYDPETRQSRPTRKYLGREDPVTGELIPSSGKRGRKSTGRTNSSEGLSSQELAKMKAEFEQQIQMRDEQIRKQIDEIKRLRSEKAVVKRKLAAILNEFAD